MLAAFKPDEQTNLQSLRNGVQSAFAIIYGIYAPKLTVHLLRLLKDQALIEEVLQDTFLVLWEHRLRVDPGKSVGPYLYKIATNKSLDIFKKANLERKLRERLYPRIEESYSHIEDLILKKENDATLQRLLAGMSERQREVFLRCKLEGKSYEETATELNISAQTVHTYIKRANQHIKEYLANHPDLSLYILLLIYQQT
ncbi:RNA polymerase sigma factor [Sphingobacterium psychroaquaticum]|uniref:RNA polymerase sigma-70 factor, ECF subfamily n=1 Tax=Sphingobacterium psychroaquaticum TaxID=561061 RepID=A0A1X7K1B7_9SPHI|nr:sigma-70 family RNA polymerase sigma factor [Sphingobacterium psychroaquaticum]SMG34475.1 RNA polymerase sigma-70 factor, ECF subfamily [Sphingobacterium psychroaquaticum]